MHRCFLFVFCLLACSPAYAQGLVTERGFGVQGGFSSHEGVTNISGRAGYVADVFEVGVTLGSSSNDVLDLSALTVGPFVGLYPVRQSADFPLSIRLGAAYGFTSFSGDEVDDLEDFGVDVSGNSVSLGGSVFSAITATPALRIIPLAEIGYSSTTIKFEAGGESDSDTEGAMVYGGTLVFAIEASPSSVFTVGPGFAVSEGETTFGVTVGMVFPN